MQSHLRIQIIGLGNPILRDDGVGIRLAHDLRKSWKGRRESTSSPDRAAAEVRFLEECSLGGLALIETVAGCDRMIVLDSIKTTGGRPGDWLHFTAASLRSTMNLSNVHDANFATALELGRRLGMALPPDEEIHIFAVEIADNLTFDDRLTPELEAAYPTCAKEIIEAALALMVP